jgi:hypothetical protein
VRFRKVERYEDAVAEALEVVAVGGSIVFRNCPGQSLLFSSIDIQIDEGGSFQRRRGAGTFGCSKSHTYGALNRSHSTATLHRHLHSTIHS